MRAPCLRALALLLGCGAPPSSSNEPTADEDSGPGTSSDAIPGDDTDSSNADAPLVPDTACSENDPRSAPIDLAVLPDAGEAPFVDAIGKATKSLRVMVYQMGYGGILDAITAKAQAGLDVRVILDGATPKSVNDKDKTALETAGARGHLWDAKVSYIQPQITLGDQAVSIRPAGNFLKS